MVKNLISAAILLLSISTAVSQEIDIVGPPIPELDMVPLSASDVEAIFGRLIEAKLEPMRRTDQQLSERIQKLEEAVGSFSAVKASTAAMAPAVRTQSSTVTRTVVPSQAVTRTVVSRPSPVRSTNSHWTYPGDSITAHLEATHRVSTYGLSEEQQLAMHDALHEGRSVQSAPVVRQSYSAPFVSSSTKSVSGPFVTRQATSTSSCPGGVCPMPQSRAYAPRSRLFGR